jgi:hypothetical protein
MPSIVTASELRSVLGVSSSLYSDAYLNDIIDTAELVILPMLVSFEAPISRTELTDDVAIFRTVGIHEFTEGQSVVITGCGATYNGTHTITDVPNPYEFAVSITNADVDAVNIIPSGKAKLSGAATYVGDQRVEAAVLNVSVDVFQSRLSPSGAMEGVDFAPSPYKLSARMMGRINGLLGGIVDVETMVQ